MDLGKQYGPLPLGAWLVAGAAGIGIALWSRNNGLATPVETVDTGGTPGVGDGSVGGWVPTTPTPTGNTPTITTNEEWARAAINWLIGQGYDASVSDSAIRKY